MTDVNPTPLLQVENLSAAVEGKAILKGLALTVRAGEVHAIMGRNGSGKSTFSHIVMGHPKYAVASGDLRFQGEDLTPLSPDERARRGIFLAFQHPLAIPGVTVANFLRAAMRAVHGEGQVPRDFRKRVNEEVARLGIEPAFIGRYVNDGFSGGEKKRLEMLQMLLLQPKLAVLDETDSGLDIDALKVVADGINRLRAPDRGIVLITHYQRILRYVTPDIVHVMIDGRIVRSGDAALALELEERGYDWLDPVAAQEASS